MARVIIDATYSVFRGRIPDRCLDWLTVEESAANWGRNFENGILLPDNHLFVAKVSGLDIIGLAMTRKRSSESFEKYKNTQLYVYDLVSLQVDPAWQRHGIGRKLIVQVAETLTREGQLTLLIRILADNPYRKFYERLGAKLIGAQPYNWEGYLTEELISVWDDIREHLSENRSAALLMPIVRQRSRSLYD